MSERLSPRQIFRLFWNMPASEYRNPLVSSGLRQEYRIGRHVWGAVLVGLITLALFLLSTVTMALTDSFFELADSLHWLYISILMGLVVWVSWLQWRMAAGLARRAAQFLSARKQSGDWELIAIAPLPKARWLRAQLAISAWQVKPLLRQLWLGHLLFFALVMLGALIDYLPDWRASRTYPDGVFIGQALRIGNPNLVTFAPSNHLHPLEFLLFSLFFGAFFVFFPFLLSPLYSAAAFYSASFTKRPAYTVGAGFVWVACLRWLVSLLTLSIGLGLVLLLSYITNELGNVETGFIQFLPVLLGLLCFYSLLLTLGIEWLPLWVLVFGTLPFTQTEWLTILAAALGGFGVGFVLMPWLGTYLLTRWTVGRLERRER